MSTSDNPTLHRLYDAVTLPSKRFSGIVGDAQHAATGGYHIGRNWVPRTDYSAGSSGRNGSSRDNSGDPAVACAIDISLSPADMALATRRMLDAAGSHQMRGVREFNGTIDGRTTLNRDAILGWRQNYTPDATHLWHIHVGFFRDTAQDWDVISDFAAVLNGGHSSQSSNDTPLSEEDVMQGPWIKRLDGTPFVFRGDGTVKSHVVTEANYRNLADRYNKAGIKDPAGQPYPAGPEGLEAVGDVDWIGVTIGADPRYPA